MGKRGMAGTAFVLSLLLLTGCSGKVPDAGSPGGEDITELDGAWIKQQELADAEPKQQELDDAGPKQQELAGEADPGSGSQEEPDADVHTPAESPCTVADPVSGYCGNTITTVRMGTQAEDEAYSFWGSDSVALTDILINLAYVEGQVCRCPVEYVVDTEFGEGYGVNLTECFVRYEGGQVSLTQEQAETIADIISRQIVIP